ncbi:hypothetical protein D3C81_1869420 [compost metagenome]
MFFTGLRFITHGRAEEYLVAAMMDAGIDYFGQVQPFGQETYTPVNLAQAPLAVNVIAVFRAVPIRCGP